MTGEVLPWNICLAHVRDNRCVHRESEREILLALISSPYQARSSLEDIALII